MDVSFSLAALDEALMKLGKPEVFNPDQGSRFASAAFTGAIAEAGVAISMAVAAAGWTMSSSNGSGGR